MSSLKILAAVAAAATFSLAFAQGTPPRPATDPAVGAGQRSTQNTPMGTTGTPGSGAAGSTAGTGAAAQGSSAGSTAATNAGSTGASGSMNSGSSMNASSSNSGTSMAADTHTTKKAKKSKKVAKADRN
jgi:hypothetical protein